MLLPEMSTILGQQPDPHAGRGTPTPVSADAEGPPWAWVSDLRALRAQRATRSAGRQPRPLPPHPPPLLPPPTPGSGLLAPKLFGGRVARCRLPGGTPRLPGGRPASPPSPPPARTLSTPALTCLSGARCSPGFSPCHPPSPPHGAAARHGSLGTPWGPRMHVSCLGRAADRRPAGGRKPGAKAPPARSGPVDTAVAVARLGGLPCTIVLRRGAAPAADVLSELGLGQHPRPGPSHPAASRWCRQTPARRGCGPGLDHHDDVTGKLLAGGGSRLQGLKDVTSTKGSNAKRHAAGPARVASRGAGAGAVLADDGPAE